MLYNIEFKENKLTSRVDEIANLAANAIILAKGHVTFAADGSIKSQSIKYVELTGLKKFGDLDVIKYVLSATLADYKNAKGIDNEFLSFVDEDTKVKYLSGIKSPLLLNTFLSESDIYLTNAKAELIGSLHFDVSLSRTALKITDNHAITKLSGSALRAGIHNQAKAVVKQMSYVRNFAELLNKNMATLVTKATKRKNTKAAKAAETKAAETKAAREKAKAAKAAETKAAETKAAETKAKQA